MSLITCCCKKLSFVFALLALAILATPAFAQTCLQDEYNVGATTKACASTPSSNLLNCTAGDVSLSQIPQGSIHVLSGGSNNPPSCFQGGSFTFTGDFDILTVANATNAGGRDNVGLYLATLPICGSVPAGTPCNPAVSAGKTTNAALCGSCADNIISPSHNADGSACTPTLNNTNGCFGSDNYHEYDTGVTTSNGTADNCGDTSSTDNSPTFGAGQEGVTIEVQNMFCGGQTCTTPTGSTGLLLNYCTSWQVPGKVIACYSPGPNYPWEPAAIPGDKSKCNCSTVCLPVTPITVTATATKECTTSLTAINNSSCDEGAEGVDAATYTVSLTPTVSSGDTIVDQICDSYYGTVVSSFSPSTCTCPAGNPCTGATPGGSSPCAAGTDIANGGSYTCTFTAPAIGENKSVTDTVAFSGHAVNNTSVKFSATTNSVNVYSEDAPSTATVTKGFVANEAACVTVRYSVDVSNTSGADETLSLTGLTDSSYGNITQLGGATPPTVLGTTCGVATGTGTFLGVCGATGTCTAGNVGATCTTNAGCNVTGAGVLPVTLGVSGSATSDYKCNFDAQFCTGAFDVNGCFTHSNTVTPALTLEDTGTGSKLTVSGGSLTVTECLTGSGS